MATSVSVCMTTYNQHKYIGEAIESVLYQKTTFPVQLVIGDDYSTDGTAYICQDYAAKHSRVTVLAHKCNLGLPRNLSLVWQECKGDYIAMLEGDDFWSSTDKLTRQVGLMEQHPEYSMCFTRTNVLDEIGSNRHRQFPPRVNCKSTLTLSDTIKHNLMANCSVMYRAEVVPKIPSWMLSLPYCDLALHCLHLQHGVSGYIPETMAVYRMHKGSAFESQGLLERVRTSTRVYAALSQHLPQPYSEQARQTLVMMHCGLAFCDWLKLPLWHKLTWWTIALEELDHLRRVR